MFFLSLKELWMCVCEGGYPINKSYFFRFLVFQIIKDLFSGQCMESESFWGFACILSIFLGRPDMMDIFMG